VDNLDEIDVPGNETQPIAVDLLVRNALLLTMDAGRRVLTGAALAVHEGVIVAIGPTRELRERYDAALELDAGDALVHPGFVDAHTHVSQHLGRSTLPDDWTYEDEHRQWLPYALAIDEEAEHCAALLAFMEMAVNGTTCFADMGGRMAAGRRARAAELVGLRGVVSEALWDRPPDPRLGMGDADACLQRVEQLLGERPAGSHRLVTGSVALSGVGACSDDLVVGAARLARAHGAVFHAHERFGRPGEDHASLLADEALAEELLGPGTMLVHVCYASPAEIARLHATGTHVVHCPAAAARVGIGVSVHGSFPQMLEAGVNVALGSDAGNFSDRFDIGLQLYLSAMMHRDARAPARTMGAEQLLEAATLDGARALGLGAVCGSLEMGKAADFVIRDPAAPESHPMLNPAMNLVYAGASRGVRDVFVAGRPVVRDGALVNLDARATLATVSDAARRLHERSAALPPMRWTPQPA
jgi:5-methylthioadenosine/S-adenosylhomocysteine deaminase